MENAVDRNLLAEFLSAYAFQPATAFWRAAELPVLIDLGIPSGRGIDIGCGDGKLTAILLRHIGNRDLTGVDPDPEEAEEARRQKVYTAVHACGAGQIPEPGASFDFAVSNGVLEHIPDLDPVLAETFRLVRPGGTFLLTVPHIGFHAQLAGALLPWITRSEYEARLDKRLAHFRYPRAAEWQAMLERQGFKMETVKFYLDRNHVRRWETISRYTAGLLSGLSGGSMHPITIQRRFGLRQFQNRGSLPRIVASALAGFLTLGLQPPRQNLTESDTGCVAIRCRKD